MSERQALGTGTTTITVETVFENGTRRDLTFTVKQVTDVQDRWVLIDGDGDGRVLLTTDELQHLAGYGGEQR